MDRKFKIAFTCPFTGDTNKFISVDENLFVSVLRGKVIEDRYKIEGRVSDPDQHLREMIADLIKTPDMPSEIKVGDVIFKIGF
jgi:hypothetical protein